MNIEQERAAFIAVAKSKGLDTQYCHIRDEFYITSTQDAWECWQASAAAREEEHQTAINQNRHEAYAEGYADGKEYQAARQAGEPVAVQVLRDLLADLEMRARMAGEVDEDGTAILDAGSTVIRRAYEVIAAHPATVEANIERAAKAVYEQLQRDEHGSPQSHPWQDGGNSLMQDYARRLANAALAAARQAEEAVAPEGWKIGDDYDGRPQHRLCAAGIHIGEHGNAIECYGETPEAAAALRSKVLHLAATPQAPDAAIRNLQSVTQMVCNMLERDGKPVRSEAAQELRNAVGSIVIQHATTEAGQIKQCWCKSTGKQCHACDMLEEITKMEAEQRMVKVPSVEQVEGIWNALDGLAIIERQPKEKWDALLRHALVAEVLCINGGEK